MNWRLDGHRHLRCIWSAVARGIPRSAFGFTGLTGETNLFCAIVWIKNVVADFRLAPVTLCCVSTVGNERELSNALMI